MSTLAAPIYASILNGKPLRFFQAPFLEPHLPWHSYNDLMRCIGAKQIHSDAVLRAIRSGHPHGASTVASGSEVTAIAPSYAARWCIKNLRGSMRNRSRHDLIYRIAMIDAWYASMRERPSYSTENLLLQAVRNTDLAEAGGHAA